jgi:hypothetical protein
MSNQLAASTGHNLRGYWSAGSGLLSRSGSVSGFIEGRSIEVFLEGSPGYSATLNGTVSTDWRQISGSGTSTRGPFTFELRKDS